MCACILTSPGQVPAGIFSVGSVPDGGAHGADQGHDQQDAKQDQDLHVGHPLHVRTLQWCFGRVLGGGHVNEYNKRETQRHSHRGDAGWGCSFTELQWFLGGVHLQNPLNTFASLI